MPSTSSKYLLEIACFDAESCVLAEQAGADRIEFCADYSSGGVTPQREVILKVKQLLNIPLHVIIRPRGGNFVYTDEEIESMKADILFCKEHNIDGVVFGILTKNKSVNKIACYKLVKLAGDMTTTFHRAIDECENIEEAMRDIINLDFDKVLTSGGKQTAIEGIDCIALLNKKYKQSINIIAGGSIRSDNIGQLFKTTECNEYHSSAITSIGNVFNELEVKKLKPILNA